MSSIQNIFGVEQTADFICEAVGKQGPRILEVGAGVGNLTGLLRNRGFDVHAIDRSAEAVARALENDVKVQKADITEFRSTAPFDAVVFSMSAHHVFPLDEAMKQVAGLVRPNGIVVFEEYAIDAVDRQTSEWYYETLALLSSLELFEMEGDPLAPLHDPLGTWRKEHSTHDDHHFNTGKELLSSIEKHFQIVRKEWVPYFFRYLSSRVDNSPLDAEQARQLFELETALIANNRIKAIGLRIVARPSHGL